MATLTTSAILFGLCYYALKTFYRAWSKSALPAWSRPVTGLLAWGVLLSFAGIVVGVADPIADLLTNPNEAAAYKIAGLAIVISAVWKYVVDNPEVLDFAHMKPFIREALAFRNLRLRRVNIFEELDKHEVRRIYRETTGKELHLKPEDDPFLRKIAQETLHDAEIRTDEKKSGKYFAEDKRVTVDQEALKKILSAPPKSPHLRLELEQLGRGERVDITDSWKINSARRSPHDFSAMVREVTIDPQAKRLAIIIAGEQFKESALQTPAVLLRIKQELYDFFRAIHEEAWMEPYLRFIYLYECVCSELVDDPFMGQQTRPLLKAEITTRELDQYKGRFFDAGSLRTTDLRSAHSGPRS